MTLTNFSYKPDWERAQSRWDAFWSMADVDRPCLAITVPRTNGRKITLPEVRSIEDQWMDPDYILASALQGLEENHFCGEAVPTTRYFMAGTTIGCGDNLVFHEGGISIRPSMDSMEAPLSWHTGPDDPWRARLEAIYRRLFEEAPGRFIVPCLDQYPPIDLLNMLRGNAEMLVDMAMEPEQCEARLRELRLRVLDNFDYFRRLIESRQGDSGWVSWTGIWCRQLFRPAQADMAAAISPDMFEQFVLPELDLWGERFGQLEFHTCGYKQHLELCLTRPYMRVIQYSPNMKEPPNGPAHMDFYRRVQQAGRCLELHVGSPTDVEHLIRHLHPRGLCLCTTARTVAEAEELMDNATRWAGSHVHQSASAGG